MNKLAVLDQTNYDYTGDLIQDPTISSKEDQEPVVWYAQVDETINQEKFVKKFFLPISIGASSSHKIPRLGTANFIEITDRILSGYFTLHPINYIGATDETWNFVDHPLVTGSFSQTAQRRHRILKNVFLPKAKKNQLVSQIIHRFKKSYNLIPDFEDGLKSRNVTPIVEDLVSSLIRFGLEDISIRATVEKSISLTLKTNNFNIYYEYFLQLIYPTQEIEGDDDQVIINIFTNKKIHSNWGGSYEDSILYIQNFVGHH